MKKVCLFACVIFALVCSLKSTTVYAQSDLKLNEKKNQEVPVEEEPIEKEPDPFIPSNGGSSGSGEFDASEVETTDETETLSNDSNSKILLYVGIGAGVAVLSVGSVFVVKAIKRRKEW